MRFGQLLRTFRLRAGWTQEELADRSGVSVHAISVLEAGRRRPRLSSLARLATALGLNPRDQEQLIAAVNAPGIPSSPPGTPPSDHPEPADPARLEPQRPANLRCQLPADTRLFTGREAEVERLLALAAEAPQGNSAGMVVLCAVDGMGGIGKSALAVHVAHRISGDFPGGQLFVDLRGHTDGLAPLTAEDVLDYLLRSLDVPPQRIPNDPAERAALYRARLAGTRTLILLDNASSTAQVRPLLPGSPGCLIVVTSRKRLAGLDDAHFLTLEALPDSDAIALLHKVAGPDRIAPDHPGVGELTKLCGNLPLAIRIVAAGMRHRRTLRLEDVIEQLRDDGGRLEQLRDEDRDLAAVFASSYGALPPAEQRLFRLLGLVPGVDLDAYTAANLDGADHRTAERLLESLLDHNLLLQQAPGRYRMHDLIRAYCRTLSEQEHSADRAAATERLLDYYQYTAQYAERLLARYTRPGTPPATAVPDPLPPLPDPARARAWLRTERANLLAAITNTDEPVRRVALTAALAPLLELDGPRSQEAALHQAAALTAHEHSLGLDEADAMWRLGRVHRLAGQFADAADMIERAQALYRAIGDRQGEANTLWELGRNAYQAGEFTSAIDLYDRVLISYQQVGDRRGEANALWDLGRAKLMLGEYSAATDLHERALACYRELGDGPGEALALAELAHLRHAAGDLSDAAVLLGQALAITRDLGDRQSQANTLWLLGRIRLDQGRYPSALELLDRALTLCRELGTRHGEASTLSALGRAQLAAGKLSTAVDLQQQALAFFQAAGDRHGEANAQHALAQALHASGEYSTAADLLRQALATFQAAGDPQAEAEVLNSLGALAAETAGPVAALDLHRRALDIARRIRSPLDEARALEGAARCVATSDREAALADLRRAVAIYRRVGAAEAEQAAAHLASLENADQPR